MLAILAARYPEPVRDHRMRFSIGGGTTAELARTTEDRFGFKVHELYGMTEVGGWVSGSTARDHKLGTNGRVRPTCRSKSSIPLIIRFRWVNAARSWFGRGNLTES